ncbi:MAG TPA: cupin domain-containing protein [Baekduia sp.]|nr:cupin domain-containing protein [Baekduia sp.]
MTRDPLTAALAQFTFRDAVLEPVEIPQEDMREGRPTLEAGVLYESPDGAMVIGATRITAGSFTLEQTTFDVAFVVKGRIQIVVDGELAVDATPGDFVRWTPGVSALVTVVEEYEEIYVVAKGAAGSSAAG